MSNTTTTRSNRLVRGGLMAVLFAGTALGGFAALDARASAPLNAKPSVSAAGTQHTVPDFADLADRVKPAVVSITTKVAVRNASEMRMPFNIPGMPRGERGKGGMAEGRGSGFIVDADGIIVTNNHVVRDADTVTVTLDSGRELPAKVLGRDARTDIAVLKVEAGEKLPWIELGQSADVRPGQWVVAVGNPFGLGGTVTAGIVSARGRDIGSGPYDDYIQVDAPINQGNSGGPLFSQDGRAIGVNTAIVSPTGGNVGIGFAIPSDMVRTVVAELRANGTVARGYLGVEMQRLTAEIATGLGIADAKAQGALVANVVPDSPAAKAGLQAGDVVQSVDGRKVTSPRDLAVAVAAVKPGETAKLEIVRGGDAKTLSVKLGTLPTEKLADRGEEAEEPGKPMVGLALAPITPELRESMKLPKDAAGVVVTEVRPDSPAQRAGLNKGDVILGVGGKTVATPEEAVTAIREAAGRKGTMALRVMRDGRTGFVAVDMAEAGKAGQKSPQQG
jgi:serine protease Do